MNESGRVRKKEIVAERSKIPRGLENKGGRVKESDDDGDLETKRS